MIRLKLIDPERGQIALRNLTALLLGLCLVLPAAAQRPPDVTAGELAVLPRYCPDTQGFHYGDASFNTSPRAAYWIGRMDKKSFWALHHHCWALIKVARAMAPGVRSEIREGMLKNAVGDYKYVIQHSTPDFVLLPEVYLKMGDALVLLKNFGAAEEAYGLARQRKPDFAPPYSRWANVLEKIDNKQGALTHLEEGLRMVPSSPELQSQYRRLGGNLDKFLKALPAAKPASGAPAELAPLIAPAAAASS